MKATSIPAHENSFQQNGIDSHGKKFILRQETVKIPGSDEMMSYTDCRRENGDKSYYYEEVTPKRKIMLHYTMGYLKGDIATLTTNHVSVPFVIGRNGIIYNLFASKYWSYHLGPGAVGGNTPMSKESVGIEVSNIGPLKMIGDNLVTTYADNDVYCKADELQYYGTLNPAYRGYQYFAKFTEAQYGSLSLLIRFLCGRYNIPKNFLPATDRCELMTESEFRSFSGIVSHVNCRRDKTDIGPAFDWDRVV